ncbi:MAG: hypothetical protein LBG43_02305 [Treponema sp.]|jgi:hypothetical protein|nr:hypothetical protein [Treponema sp.]
MEYRYITDNNLENRQSYQYSEFQGERFLAAYKESRNALVLKGAPVIQKKEIADYCANIAENYYQKPVKQEYVVLRYELCAFLHAILNENNKNAEEQEFAMFDKIVKTFEVRKRLYHCYNGGFRPLDESDFYDCGLYLLFACGLVFAYKEKRNLKYLNALLKANDALISLAGRLNDFELAMLRYALSEETRMVQAFYRI